MLEAKAEDHEHRHKCSPKKKGLQKFFSGDLQNFNDSKNGIALESRRAVSPPPLENLTFEAKDFKMCHRGRTRGQERPRGLYLW